MDRLRLHWSNVRAESACVHCGRGNTHALRPTPEPEPLLPATVQTADEMDGLRENMGPHRLPRVHLLVVSMQSTGVYWIAVSDILEQAGLEVYLVNARDTKNLPGRKTDVQESQWLMKLHTYGLLRNSFGRHGESAPCGRIGGNGKIWCRRLGSMSNGCRRR